MRSARAEGGVAKFPQDLPNLEGERNRGGKDLTNASGRGCNTHNKTYGKKLGPIFREGDDLAKKGRGKKGAKRGSLARSLLWYENAHET